MMGKYIALGNRIAFFYDGSIREMTRETNLLEICEYGYPYIEADSFDAVLPIIIKCLDNVQGVGLTTPVGDDCIVIFSDSGQVISFIYNIELVNLDDEIPFPDKDE